MTDTTAPWPEQELPEERSGDGTDEEQAGEPDTLTGASPDADEIQAADPSHDPDATEYELRSGIETSPSDQDPGSMLNR